MGDALFDIPELGILQVHQMRHYPVSDIQYESDDQGWPEAQQFEGGEPFMGYATSPSVRRLQTTFRVDCIVRGASLTMAIEPGDWIVIPEQDGLLPQLAGTYTVNPDGVRPNPMDIRLLLSRPKKSAQRDAVDTNPMEDMEYT